MPHGNLWGWGETGRRDSVSGAVAADAVPEPSKAGRLLVLVNPAAGKGRGVAATEDIRKGVLLLDEVVITIIVVMVVISIITVYFLREQ